MDKKSIIAGGIIFIILIISIVILPNNKSDNKKETKIINKKEIVDEVKLSIDYYGDPSINESISYGNIIQRIISVENVGDKALSFAIKLDEAETSNMDFTTDVLMSNSLDGDYVDLKNNSKLEDNFVLQYNIGIEPKEKIFLKINLKDVHENELSTIKGKLKIISNLSDKDVFLKEISNIYNNINKKIEGKNGISEKGYYIIDAKSISSKISGYILLDTMDISDIKYYFTVYDSKFLINKKEYNNIEKKIIENKNDEYVNSITFDSVCSNFTKRGCDSFDSLGYNEKGTKTNFYNNVNRVINELKNSFNNKDKQVYIYDVTTDITNNTDVRGYILINNIKNEKEYYLYLTNNTFMISGYNLTKYGDIVENGSTIRAYNDTAWNLSSESMSAVCGFTGFTGCLNKNGDLRQ